MTHEPSNLRALTAAYLQHWNKTSVLNKVSSVYFLVTSLMAKPFTYFLSLNIQIMEKGVCVGLQGLKMCAFRKTEGDFWSLAEHFLRRLCSTVTAILSI